MVDVFVKKEFSSDVDTGDMQTEKKQVVRDYIAKGQTCDCPPHDFEELPKKGAIAHELREGHFLHQFEASKSKHRRNGRKLVQTSFICKPGQPRKHIDVIDHSK